MAGPGRPLKFKTVEDLERQISDYFESCFEDVWEKVPVYDDDGKTVFRWEWVQEFDRLGRPVKKQVRPFTITGLALHLDTSRETLINYESREQYFDAIKRAKARCENYLEEGTLTGDIPAAAGIFGLKNFGWRDRQEHDVNMTAQISAAELIDNDEPGGTATD